jgi:hypothetical protein
MQVPILNGVYTNGAGDYRVAYPRNMVPVAVGQGISPGYLRPADGIVQFGTGPGVDRGGINWRDACYRVMGTDLVKIAADGSYTTIGSVGSGGQCTLDYSFDYLGISSGGSLYLYNGSTLRKVTDGDLGNVLDFLWVDGYFLTTDGNYLVVTELNDPFSVNPLKYGSSEADPDSIRGVLKLRNEVYALNRFTIEVFQNVGGTNFPFSRIEGAQMQRGAIGTYTACVFMENIAFLGGGRNEAPSIWIGSNSSTAKVASREIDLILRNYTETVLAQVVLEARVTNGQQLLYIHLPDQTLVYDGQASATHGEPVWFVLASSLSGIGQYRAKNLVWCYDKWLCGDPTSSAHGYLTESTGAHYGQPVEWELNTQIVYNAGAGAVFHDMELVCIGGNVALGTDPTIWTSYSLDGQNWSQERPRSAGKQGERIKRLAWLQCGAMRHWRCQKFRGTSDAHLSVACLEARIEPLNV